MKNNVITSVMWTFIIIACSILIPIGLKSETTLIYFIPLFAFLIVFGVLYYLSNSYSVYRKFKYLKIDTKKNRLLIVFPFLIFSSKELSQVKFEYNSFLKFLTIIVPLIVSFIITGIMTTIIFISLIDPEKIKANRELFLDRYATTILFSILFGWGFLLLSAMFLIAIVVKLRSTGFFRKEKNVFKNIWRLLMLPYYFPKFYFENLDVKKHKIETVPVGNFYHPA